MFVYLLALFLLYSEAKNANPAKSRVASTVDEDTETSRSKSSTNPGARIRVTQNGLNYLNRLFDKILLDTIPNAHIPDVEKDFGGGHITLTKLEIDDYKSPDSYTTVLKPPNKILWTMTNMRVGMKGHFSVSSGLTKGSGDFTGSVDGVAISVTVKLSSQNELFHIEVPQCKATIRKTNMDIDTDDKAFQALFAMNKLTVLSVVQMRMQQEICSKITSILSKDLNAKIAGRGHKVRLADLKQQLQQNKSVSLGGATASQNQDRVLNVMFLDYGLVSDPQVENQFVDLMGRGEVSYMGNGGTPFTPSIMSAPSSSNRMLYLSVGDYVLNSFFHHAFKNQLLKFRLNVQNYPELSGFLSTNSNCPKDECLGSMFPDSGSVYPNSKMQILVEPTAAPVLTTSSGKANIQLKGTLTLLDPQGAKELLKTNCDLDADFNLASDHDRIKGSVLVKKFNLNLLSTTLKNVDQAKLNQVSQRAKQAIEVPLNSALKRGLPVPLGDDVKLVNPQFKLMNGFFQAETDIDVNRTALVKHIKQRMAREKI